MSASGLPVMFFAVKHPESFISCRFFSFGLRLELYSHEVRLYSFCVSCMAINMKEKSPWLKNLEENLS